MNTTYTQPTSSNDAHPSLLVDLAVRAFAEHDYAAALCLAHRALSAAPASVAARNVLAAALHRTGRTAEAIAQFRSAIAAQPGDPVPLFNLAGALSEANRSEDSLVEIQRLFALAARADPSQAWIFQRAALLHQQVQTTLAQNQGQAADRAIATLSRSAEALSGYPVRIVSDGLPEGVYACVEIASASGADHHVLRCNRLLPHPVRCHALAHELIHILLASEARAAGQPTRCSLSPSGSESLSAFYEKPKRRLHRQGCTRDELQEAVAEDMKWLTRTMVNRSVDLVVESRLHRLLPELRAAQFLALDAWHHVPWPTPSQLLARAGIRPRALMRMGLAVDCVSAMLHDSPFAGATDYAGSYRGTEVFPLATRLWEHWQAASPFFGPGDECRLVGDFARLLGLGSVFGFQADPPSNSGLQPPL
jgi:hypothetical protein